MTEQLLDFGPFFLKATNCRFFLEVLSETIQVIKVERALVEKHTITAAQAAHLGLR